MAMAYEFVLRKYRLKHRVATWREAKQLWETQLQERPAEEWFLDEFPVQSKPKGLVDAVVKQLTGK